MEGQILYVECFSGVSGDMTVASLLDLGADKKVLLDGLNSLNIGGYTIEITNVVKNKIKACDFNVIIKEDYVPSQERNLSDIYKIIDNSSITLNSKNISKKIFKIKAEAEAKAHNVDIENVYFHEKGAIDSIVDIVGAAICLDNLEVKDAVVSEIYDGCGFVKCRRGIISVPVPAVKIIAKEYNLNLKITNTEGEMVTPTGASIMAAIKSKESLPEDYKIEKVGLGAGKREYPNETGILRTFLIKSNINNIMKI